MLSRPVRQVPSSRSSSSWAVLRIRRRSSFHLSAATSARKPALRSYGIKPSSSTSFRRASPRQIRESPQLHPSTNVAPKRSPHQPTAGFHMKTRIRANKGTPQATGSSAAYSPPTQPESTTPTPATSRKRKASDASDSHPKTKRRQVEGSDSDKEFDFLQFTDGVFWPQYDAKRPRYYAGDATIRTHAVENGNTPESHSPKKPSRAGGRARGGVGNGGGRGRGKQKARGGRSGESPEPPNRKRPLTQDDRVEISMLKARQQELKRFFAVVGAQQVDILEALSLRDLSKIARKPKAHKHVPEYETVAENLEGLMKETQEMIEERYNFQVEYERQRLEQEKEVIEQKFQTHVIESRKEHLAGAEGDIILFERAYRAAHDDTHTESGSDMDYFPRYHELPEPDSQPRGYLSGKIMDEKPFKPQPESFDEQARQEVLNEDVIAPLLKQIEKRNNEWREEQIRKKSQTLDALSAEAIKELEKIPGRLIPRPLQMHESNSYALSALADVADWVALQHPERPYVYMPLASGDGFRRPALEFSPVPGPPYPVIRPASSNRQFKYTTNGQATSAPPPPPPLSATEPGVPSLSRFISSGPGQPIAPAPPKPVTRSSGPTIFRHSTRMGSQSSPALAAGPQQFIFQPPQQPFQHQAAPGPSPTPQYGPAGAGAPVGQQTKIPMTFVNQTIASRSAAAAGNGNGNGKGGQRMLLPKM
ncbi:uncharacterized protein Z518_09313 [Rhinocladiella mackenziei CBS 650.93]|uniref:Uncharacterized protein n=1 Tax=Rhinocladiella mackenziei CBS 650.93 TaxID=1442369 RepID=A0A0D2FHY6_9EURO|nr:uncharacterized protein Z518_09313 [Rhinocladiella mackenziei CBS 650.93]KIX01587.1 hypothetical protein Z518_09313 [Rhinocladiella mackenziei CBS 650.93]